MVNHHLVTFGSHRYCGSRDITFLLAEEEHSGCSHFNPPLLFISKEHDLKAQQQLDKSLKITFASSSKNALGKKKENDASWKSFYVTLKRNNKSMTI